jgi:biopolymer transport protein ExbD
MEAAMPSESHTTARPGAAASGAGSVRSEINVTPLVDVCLVLLIIFMVVTPLMGGDRPGLLLPETSRPERIGDEADALTLTIAADGRIQLGDEALEAERLGRVLGEARAQKPDRKVRIKADRRLRYEQVRDVMRTVNEAGFSGAGLITTRKDPGAAA